jgi:lipopolysaccharide/colanic/teichoic acid biosynthesis glycosyltransferase
MYIKYVKRIIDLLIAICALPIFCIAFILLAPFYLIIDRGPMLYSGKRIGQYGKPFPMHKFRSMKINAPDIRLADGSTYNGDDDPRVTKLGKFIRKTSIDEIPQILNIIKGDMSLIGPRPDPLDWIDKYKESDKIFLNVKPGITGYSQAYFRNSADARQKIENDIFYANNVSFYLDIKIFFRTIKTVACRENINVTEDRK